MFKGLGSIAAQGRRRASAAGGGSGTICQQVGNAFSIGTLVYNDICALDSNTVVVASSNTNSLKVYSFDGTDWSQDGNTLSITLGAPALCRLSSTEIALVDSSVGELRHYTWDGTDLSEDGSGLAITNTGAALVELSSTEVVLLNGYNETMQTYTWGGSSWSSTGNSKSLTAFTYGGLAAPDSSTVMVTTNVSKEIAVYDWDGTDFTFNTSQTIVDVGNYGYPEIITLDSTTLVTCDSAHDLIRFWDWNGSSITQTHFPYYLHGTAIVSLARLDATTFAQISSAGGNMRTLEIVAGTATYEAQIINPLSPIFYARLGDTSGTTATEEVNGYDGTCGTGVTVNQTGALMVDSDKAMQFDGTGNGDILFGDHTDIFAFGTGDFAVEFFIKSTGTATTQQLFMNMDTNDFTDGGWQINLASGYPRFILQDSVNAFGDTLTSTDVSILNDGTWHHIVCQRNSGTMEIWVDGTRDSTTKATTYDLTDTGEVFEMKCGSFLDDSNPFTGYLDELVVHNSALSSAEIAKHAAYCVDSI